MSSKTYTVFTKHSITCRCTLGSRKSRCLNDSNHCTIYSFVSLGVRGFFLKNADLQFIPLGFQRCQALFCCLGDDAFFYRCGNVVNFLMRFYEVNSGNISIDDVPITAIKRENLHDVFGMVLQDTWMFEGTVRENLVYNKQNVTDEMLDEVCRAVGLIDLINQLPHRYDTVLSDSTGISAGQKQLFTIARAMLKDAPLMILDEATSSVDTRTELQVQRAMDVLTQGRTSFIIAHRLSTIKNADCILVMKDGNILESGNHEALMKKGGFYAELYNSQFEQGA